MTGAECFNTLRADRSEWRDPEPLHGGLAAFYDHCDECFDEPPEIGTVVVRSTSNRAAVYHRPDDVVDCSRDLALADGGRDDQEGSP